MKQVLCVWFPDFPIQRLHSQRPELKSSACVLYKESGNRARIVMSSSEAKRYGIQFGMSLAEAQALLETAAFLPQDSEADTLALQKLARLCHHYSPVVGIEQTEDSHGPETHCLLLDITGCTHLFGNEFNLAGRLVADLAGRGYFTHVAVASTIGAAWAIAHYGHKTGTDRRLRSLPVEALRIPGKLVDCLHEFDLHLIGQVKTLPRDSLPSRFGEVLTNRIDQMFDQREEIIVPVPRAEPVSAEWKTDEPINHPEAIRYVCEDLLTEIFIGLDALGEGLLQLTIAFGSEAANRPTMFTVGLTRPTDSPKHVMGLLSLKLETLSVPEWLSVIRMEASSTAPLHVRQQQLFDEDEPGNADVSRLIDQLSARLGRQAVVRPRVLPEAVPEQAVAYDPLAGSATKKQPQEFAVANRPLELLPKPKPIQVGSIADGMPETLQWNRRNHQVIHCTRREQIQTGWWQDTGSVRRGYYQVETKDGARLWIFQDDSEDWFLHGVFG